MKAEIKTATLQNNSATWRLESRLARTDEKRHPLSMSQVKIVFNEVETLLASDCHWPGDMCTEWACSNDCREERRIDLNVTVGSHHHLWSVCAMDKLPVNQ